MPFGIRGDSHRKSHVIECLTSVLGDGVFRRCTKMFASLTSLLNRSVRKNKSEFFAAVPANDVFSAKQILENLREFSEQGIACVVAKRIVKALEVVHIHHHHAQRTLFPVGASQFPLQRCLHVPTVEEPGKRIANGLGLENFAEVQVSECERDVLGESSRETKLRFVVRVDPVGPIGSVATGVAAAVEVKNSQGLALRHHRHAHGVVGFRSALVSARKAAASVQLFICIK
jgi:hypothetical protein